jgi:phosphatidylserine decarboxylase
MVFLRLDRLFFLWLTQAVGCLAQLRANRWNRWAIHAAIRGFVRYYRVNLQEAAMPDPSAYSSFNDFFSRAISPGSRPLAASDWISPVDGCVSQSGRILQGQIFQAKGHHYSATALLGQDDAAASAYLNGSFVTLYLSPKDYHRIHMPCTATLKRMVYVPGQLLSVNPTTAQRVPGLFARNERVVCHFETAHGPLVMVLVGATIVGSIATVWHGTVNPPRRTCTTVWHYDQSPPVSMQQGEVMGRFALGSTVIVMWPEATAELSDPLRPQHPVRMGQALAKALAPCAAASARAC